MVRTAGNTARYDRGAAAVEFAIVLPLLLLVMAGVVDFGRAFYTQVTLTNAAREGARVAVIGSSAGSIDSRAKAAIPNEPLKSDADVDPSPENGCEGVPAGSAVTVTVTAPFNWIILEPMMNFFGGVSTLPDDLSSSATMRCGG